MSTKVKTRNPNGIYQWADLGDVNDVVLKLKEIARSERWYFKVQDASNPYPILKNYLIHTFTKVKIENKICYADKYAIFNTGLVDKLYEPIYAVFEKSTSAKQPWVFVDFCIENHGIGKTINKILPEMPKRAEYLSNASDVLFDSTYKMAIDWEHIIISRVDRLPDELLHKNNPAHFTFEDISKMNQTQRNKYFYKLKNAIEKDEACLMRIKNELEASVNLAKKRVACCYKTAIPTYYPEDNTMSFLLPLEIVKAGHVDVALVVEKIVNDKGEIVKYECPTILPLEWAYSDARLVTKPDGDWLMADKIDTEEPKD